MMIIRTFDILFSFFGMILLSPLLIFVFMLGLLDTGKPLFIQKRVGKNKKPFNLIKFRTMKVNTKSVASHLVDSNMITKFGSLLRRTKIDELPQLWNVFLGEMSFVGPRPNLFNQKELIEIRDEKKIYLYRPGITGLAQIKRVDMSKPLELSALDIKMMRELSIKKYFYYIFKTIYGSGRGDVVK